MEYLDVVDEDGNLAGADYVESAIRELSEDNFRFCVPSEGLGILMKFLKERG